MKSNLVRVGLVVAVAFCAIACDQAPAPQTTGPPPPPPVQADLTLRNHAGETFAAFSATTGARYTPDALGLSASDSARVLRSMATGQPGEVLAGGGAQALVFGGCADTGCADGRSVVAIDLATGDAFVGVHDTGGRDVLEPNDRLEALLRLNSPTRSWDDPQAVPAAPERP